MTEQVTFTVDKGWPTPNNCRRVADALDAITPARYGDILRAYADAEDARFALASSAPATASEGATCGKCEWNGYGPNGCEHATGVTSSDGDRGLNRHEILLALAQADGQPWESIAEASEHTAEMMYGKQADVVERILAARTTQPVGNEWGVLSRGQEVKVSSEAGARRAIEVFGGDLIRRTVTPWEVVDDE